MKKVLYALVLMVLVLPLAGYVQSVSLDTANDPWGLSLTADNIEPTGCRLTYTQFGGAPTGSLQYGSEFHIERKVDSVWTEVPMLPSDDIRVWSLIAIEITPDSNRSVDLDWSSLYGTLPAGHYRIRKVIMDFRKTGDYDTCDYYAEFEVK